MWSGFLFLPILYGRIDCVLFDDGQKNILQDDSVNVFSVFLEGLFLKISHYCVIVNNSELVVCWLDAHEFCFFFDETNRHKYFKLKLDSWSHIYNSSISKQNSWNWQITQNTDYLTDKNIAHQIQQYNLFLSSTRNFKTFIKIRANSTYKHIIIIFKKIKFLCILWHQYLLNNNIICNIP